MSRTCPPTPWANRGGQGAGSAPTSAHAAYRDVRGRGCATGHRSRLQNKGHPHPWRDPLRRRPQSPFSVATLTPGGRVTHAALHAPPARHRRTRRGLTGDAGALPRRPHPPRPHRPRRRPPHPAGPRLLAAPQRRGRAPRRRPRRRVRGPRRPAHRRRPARRAPPFDRPAVVLRGARGQVPRLTRHGAVVVPQTAIQGARGHISVVPRWDYSSVVVVPSWDHTLVFVVPSWDHTLVFVVPWRPFSWDHAWSWDHAMVPRFTRKRGPVVPSFTLGAVPPVVLGPWRQGTTLWSHAGDHAPLREAGPARSDGAQGKGRGHPAALTADRRR